MQPTVIRTKEERERLDPFNKNLIGRNGEDLKWLLAQPQFRRYIGRHMEACGIFKTVASDKSHEMNQNEGKRMVGVTIKDEIDALDPEAFYQIDRDMKNQQDRKQKIAAGILKADEKK